MYVAVNSMETFENYSHDPPSERERNILFQLNELFFLPPLLNYNSSITALRTIFLRTQMSESALYTSIIITFGVIEHFPSSS